MDNITKVFLGRPSPVTTSPLYQWDYGQKLKLTGINLPQYYEVHFAVSENGNAYVDAVSGDTVSIPDALLEIGSDIYAWVYIHTGDDDGETVYKIKIPVIARAKPSDDSLTPSERSAVTEAVSLLRNSAQQLEEAKESFESNQLNVEFDDTENIMVFTKGVNA